MDADSTAIRLLALDGIDVQPARSGAEAVAMLSCHRPFDAILLDLRLGDEDGLDVLQRIAPLTPAPIGILTGYGDTQTAVAALQLGASDYHEKRLVADGLSGVVLRLAARGPRFAPQLSEAEWIDVHLRRLSTTDSREEILRRLLTLLISRRVTLRFHVALADAVRSGFNGLRPLEIAIREVVEQVVRARTDRWTTHPVLLAAFAELERDVPKQSVRVFGGRMPLSRAYLSHRMSRDTGRSPAFWCRAAAVRRGLRLLVETGEAVSQIAYQCGYEHHSQFDRDFSKLYGAAPRVVRGLGVRVPL